MPVIPLVGMSNCYSNQGEKCWVIYSFHQCMNSRGHDRRWNLPSQCFYHPQQPANIWVIPGCGWQDVYIILLDLWSSWPNDNTLMFQVLVNDALIRRDHSLLHRMMYYERDASSFASCAVQPNDAIFVATLKPRVVIHVVFLDIGYLLVCFWRPLR